MNYFKQYYLNLLNFKQWYEMNYLWIIYVLYCKNRNRQIYKERFF